ncbi:MAG: putative bifunctional diguanylate cyclase/phosphodiesterase [Methylophilaceae bacterium]
MQLNNYITSNSRAKPYLIKLGTIALVYFAINYAGIYLLPYIDTPRFFEFSAIAVGAVVAIKYGFVGVLGATLGSLCFHLLKLPLEFSVYFALVSGFSAYLFRYFFNWLHPSVVVLSKVSCVASFALVVTPIICAIHTIGSQLILWKTGLMEPESLTVTMLACWYNELLIAYLTVPLMLSLLAYKKTYFSTQERTEMLTLLFGMVAVSWFAMDFSQIPGVSVILILTLLVFVLWASLRFNCTVAQGAIFVASILVLMSVIFSDHALSPEPYQQTLLIAKIGISVMILGGLFVAAAFSERNHVEVELSKLANHDPLTGLPNRTYFQDFVLRSLSHAQRQKQQLYLLFIDLDRFKKINDSQGHEVGDAVLKIVARRLDNLLRADDFIARLGGDEFAVLYSHPKINKAASNLARKIIKIISEPFEIGERTYSVGASIGISVYPDDTDDPNTLLRQADLAMYQAKNKQSGYEYFSEEMNALAHEQLQMENGLRYAIEAKELLLMYQPKIDLRTNTVVGLEALVRWVTKDGEMIGPDKFIPIAEEAGLIIPIGRYVIQEACEQWVRWHNEGLNPPAIAVNISPRQFSDPQLVQGIADTIKSTGVDPSKLHVEITESATMEDPEATLETLKKMHELKLHIYIDDFGTGYSNLGQLRHLPIDALKIDKVFINDIMVNDDDAEIVTAIINLAHALKLRVVCEGVETKAQLTLLKGLGSDEVQGYFISKPIASDKVHTFFNKEITL